MRKRDTTKRCFVCTKLGNLAKKYMKRGRVEDEKKAKANNIRSQMRKQWIRKSPENASQSPDNIDTQAHELGNSTISNLLSMEITRTMIHKKHPISLPACK